MKIINGDAIIELSKFENNYFDIIFTSPPYNLFKNNFECEKWDTVGKIQKYGDLQKDKIDNYVDFIVNVVLLGIEKAQYFFLNIQGLANNKRDIIEINYKLSKYYCDTIIWYKKNGIPNGCNKRVMTNTFEYIFVYSKNNSRAIGTKQWNGTVGNVIEIKSNSNNKYAKIHKALFPVELPLWIFKNFVKDGGKILDCFGGLGTSIVAADKLGLDGTMIELNDYYCDIAKQRIKEAQTTLIKGEL